MLLFLTALPASAQVATGTPPFGFYAGGPDIVNLGNLNDHIAIPVLSKRGRGLDFNFALVYDSSVWSPVTSGSTKVWQPVANWGWTPITVGYASYIGEAIVTMPCFDNGILNGETGQRNTYVWTYHDSIGILHWLGFTEDGWGTCHGQTPPTTSLVNAPATDGSGYTFSATGGSATSLYDKKGKLINAPVNPNFQSPSAASVTDRNGNQITNTSAGVFTDTLGATALTVTSPYPNPSPITLAYTAPSGATATFTVKYAAYTVQTNFGCSGISEYPATSINLVSEIDLPDYDPNTNPNSRYLFDYENTPGDGHSPHYRTGRLASVTLPTGGTISYTYAGGSNGIVCADGSTATLNRTTPDSTTAWIYARSQISGTHWQTKVTSPAGDDTVIDFQEDSASPSTDNFYEVQRVAYQGLSSSGNVLRQWFTCYNGNGTPSTCATTAVSSPILQQTVTDQYGSSGLQCQHFYRYNYVGGLTEQDDYDYGSGAPGGLLRQVLTTYAGLGNITGFPQQVTVKNGSGTTVSQTSYNYDQGTLQSTSSMGIPQHASISGSRGNLTSINYPISGLTASFTYYDTGSPYTSQDVNNATTTYTYGTDNTKNCSMAFPTGISEPSPNVPLSRSFTWNCTGGVQLTVKDENLNTTTTDYTDNFYWRPADVKDPDTGETDWTYTSATSLKTTTKMNSSQNIVSTVLLDSLGRAKEQQLNSDPEGVVYLDTTYDSLGRVYTVSNRYRTTSDPTYGLTTTIYDALSRPCVIIPPDGTSASTCPTSQPTNDIFATYSGNTTTVADQAGKKRTSTLDSLGRLTQVLEDPSGNNYETDYGYDALGNLLCVGQKGTNTGAWSGCSSIPASWRARSYSYDAMSRLTGASDPETGTITYGYDANGNQGDLTSRVAPAPNQTGSNTITTTYTHDSLHRLTQKSYSDGTTTAARFSYDSGGGWGITQNNVAGRMSEAWTGTACCIVGAAQIFSYDPRGRVVLNNQCTPIDCPSGGAPVSYTYDLAGNTTSYTTGVGVTFTQAFDAAGRPTSLTSTYVDSQHPATLASTDSSVGYYPFGALRKMNLGNSLTQTAAFNKDLQPCRINVNSSAAALGTCADAIPTGNVQDYSYGFNFGSSDNGSVASWAGTGQQSFNRTYTYDALNRLSTLSSPSDPHGCTGLSWTYDAWDNRTAQTTTGGSCPQQPSTTFSANNQLPSPYAYDAAGNTTYDGSHYYFYDAENRLIQVQSTSTLGACSAAIACYTYDALGRRVESAVGSTTTDYLYDLSGRAVTDMNNTCGNPCWAVSYIYMNGSLAAQYKNSTTYFVHPDHLGSTRLLTAVNQSVVEPLDYLPFGELNSSNSGYTTHMFTGDERDSETGLDHTLFRKYSSNLGRWMSPDPAGLAVGNPSNPQSWNRYAYVRNAPLQLIDRLGLVSGPILGGLGANCVEDGFAVPCFMESTAGTTIFDAIHGVPGTYLTLDIYGNVGYGFSSQLWSMTENFVDANPYLAGSPALAVYNENFGIDQIISGLVPQYFALMQERAQTTAAMPSKFADDMAFQVDENISAGMDPTSASLNALGYEINVIQIYAAGGDQQAQNWLGLWANYQWDLNAWENQWAFAFPQ